MKKLAVRMVFSLVVLVLVLGSAEAVARYFPLPTYTVPQADEGKEMLEGSPFLLWELQPGVHSWRTHTISVNSARFRDKERGPKSRPRAMSLGDSSVYGFGVNNSEVFTSILEENFDADFINGATPGYSTIQSLNLLTMRGLALEPDVLLVANLWSDNNFDKFVDTEVINTYAVWDTSFSGLLHSSFSKSNLFKWMDWKLRIEPGGLEPRTVGWMSSRMHGENRRRVPINTYADNLAAMCTMMERRGGGVVFVMLPHSADVATPGRPQAWNPYRQVMRDTAERCEAPLVELPAFFQASGLSANELFMDEMHPTARGHQLMAEALTIRLKELSWPTQPLRVKHGGSPPEYKDIYEENAAPPPPPPNVRP